MESKHMLKEFSLDPNQAWRVSMPFGGGWTPETEPSLSRGWTILRFNKGDTAILGRRVKGVPGGKPGCFYVVPVPGKNEYEMHLYGCTPKELDATLKLQEAYLLGRPEALSSQVVQGTPGWALQAVLDLEASEARSAK